MEPPEELECSSEVAPVRLSENLGVEQKPAVEPRGPERVIPERVVLPVAPPPQEKDGGEPLVFLEVLNQEMKSESFPHNFTVCFSTMFDFTNTLQLVQSIEMLRLLGVTRVVVYKTNCSSKTQVLLDYYQNTGLVEVIPWHLSSLMNVSRGWQPQYSPGQMHYYGQIPALTDCVYRYMYRSKYLALHDMDELILPQTVDR
ncbi:glycosyltransferase family 92 protein F13G3.3-like [Lampris incognitus]|uniref:glycosyltransferase family 92 protein F13G3.3-like n=1 Tax=Lampris incognitus TaxID=2546036 RepID=UPI0024B54FC2|nr:glycosyltransferase family 92 protein F13G3.3-like [Lampris incognitus]